MTDKTDERLLERVRALLAKAERTDNPHEAEAFFAKASELMSKYAIDRAMLDAKAGSAGEPIPKKITIQAPYSTEKVALLHIVGKANRCRTIMVEKHAVIFGFAPDIEATELLFTNLLMYAVGEIGKIGPEETYTGDNPAHRRWQRRTSWMVGFSSRIGERLTEAVATAMRSAARTHGNSMAVVLADRGKLVDDLVSRTFPHTRRANAPKTYDSSAYSAGRAAANGADLGQKRVAQCRALQS